MQTVLIGGVPKILCRVPSMTRVPLELHPWSSMMPKTPVLDKGRSIAARRPNPMTIDELKNATGVDKDYGKKFETPMLEFCS
ncbi:hypothetical protein TNCV_3488371 [Trichonephila clavipes]|nr:hypothetical protein TNCV_3488371 [Trichonephila clavipes]